MRARQQSCDLALCRRGISGGGEGCASHQPPCGSSQGVWWCHFCHFLKREEEAGGLCVLWCHFNDEPCGLMAGWFMWEVQLCRLLGYQGRNSAIERGGIKITAPTSQGIGSSLKTVGWSSYAVVLFILLGLSKSTLPKATVLPSSQKKKKKGSMCDLDSRKISFYCSSSFVTDFSFESGIGGY